MEQGWINFPGVDANMIRNHPHSEATARGHLDRTRSGFDSTTTIRNAKRGLPKSNLHISESECRRTIFADLTGRFPTTSNMLKKDEMLRKKHVIIVSAIIIAASMFYLSYFIPERKESRI